MKLFCFLGFICISLCGSFLHFVYDWLKHNKYVSLFVAVNESTWEHLKLAMLPTFAWSIVGAFVCDCNNFAFGCFVALLAIVLIIPLIFYSYTNFTKKPILAIDILSFFIAIGLGMLFAYSVFKSPKFGNWAIIVGVLGLVLFVLMFVVFTYFPPRLFLFKDPITGKFGVQGHYDDKEYGNDFKLK